MGKHLRHMWKLSQGNDLFNEVSQVNSNILSGPSFNIKHCLKKPVSEKKNFLVFNFTLLLTIFYHVRMYI